MVYYRSPCYGTAPAVMCDETCVTLIEVPLGMYRFFLAIGDMIIGLLLGVAVFSPTESPGSSALPKSNRVCQGTTVFPPIYTSSNLDYFPIPKFLPSCTNLQPALTDYSISFFAYTLLSLLQRNSYSGSSSGLSSFLMFFP